MRVRGRIPGKPGLWEIDLEADTIWTLRCVDAGLGAERGDWLTPGLFDLQINGIAGIGFTNPSVSIDELASADQLIRAKGISRYCPTVITRDTDTTLAVLERFKLAWDARAISGAWAIHLEGPYISPEDGYRGVHQKRFTRDPDWEEFARFQHASGDRIRLVTIAPERAGSEDFIRRAVDSGVMVSMGHSNAEPADIARAVGAGLRLSTHLFNGCARLVDRHRNVIYSQLSNDALTALFIADSHHVPLSLLRAAIRAKEARRCILASDISQLSGLPDGEYEMEGNRVEVKDGGIWVKGSYLLSGAARTLDRDVEILAREPEPGIECVLRMASANPACAVGEGRWAELAAGRKGPLAVFSWDGKDLVLKQRIGF